jgi:IS1 family transposase
MNKLPLEKQVQIINLLVKGNSLRAASRITGASINTVTKLLVEVGKTCQDFHNETVKEVTAKRIQCDEIWSFVSAKQKKLHEGMDGGDVWTWTAIDADTNLIVSWLVGDRSAETAEIFFQDIAYRLKNRVQLTTEGHKAYLNAIENVFSNDIDIAQLIKLYGGQEDEVRYSPAVSTLAKKTKISGTPNEKRISTNYVERQNLTMRMSVRRFTRLTNAFSKKMENYCYAIALHFVYYNFCMIHKSLRVTPAVEAGLTKDSMEIEDIIKLVNN